jgi:aminopeptidase N
MVTVKVEGKNLTLTQKRFKQSNGIQNDHNDLYNLPITYAIDSDNYVDTKPKFVFRTTDGVNKTFEMSKEVGKYIILNVQQTGYYRVNYDGENWKNIRTALYSKDHDKIHVMNRAQIVDDLFQFARAGTVDYATAMDIIQYIKDETNYIPWLSAINFGLTYLSQRVKKDKRNQELFSAYIQDTMSKIYDHLEFREPSSKDRRTDIYNRANILTWACKYGHEGCIKKSQELFAEYRKGTKINKDIRAVVYCNGIRYGNESDFNYLFDKYQNENILQEQLNIVAGTACTKDQNLANVS